MAEEVSGDEVETVVSNDQLFEFTENADADKVGGELGEIKETATPSAEGEDGGEEQNEGEGSGLGINIPKQGGGSDGMLAKQIEALNAKLDTLTADKEKSQVNEEREKEKVSLKNQYGAIQKKLAIAYKNPQRNANTIAQLQGQLSIVTNKAAIIENEEKQEKAQAEEAEKKAKEGGGDAGGQNREIPEATKTWLTNNKWFDDPNFHQWRAAAQQLSDQLVNAGYDDTSPAFYEYIDSELKKAGFKKPTASNTPQISGIGLNINKGGQKQRTGGSPTRPTNSTKGGGDKPLKLDSQRTEMFKGLGIGNDEKAAKIYKKNVLANINSKK